MDLSTTTETELKKFLDTKEMELATSLLECKVVDAGQAEVLKRLKIRVRASLPLVYSYNLNTHIAHTRDISVGGAYILTNDPPPVGAKIVIAVRLSSLGVDLKTVAAEVVRVNEVQDREEPGFAVEFENLRQDHLMLLFKFVNKSLGSGRS